MERKTKRSTKAEEAGISEVHVLCYVSINLFKFISKSKGEVFIQRRGRQ
jgi:hypothetical protein